MFFGFVGVCHLCNSRRCVVVSFVSCVSLFHLCHLCRCLRCVVVCVICLQTPTQPLKNETNNTNKKKVVGGLFLCGCQLRNLCSLGVGKLVVYVALRHLCLGVCYMCLGVWGCGVCWVCRCCSRLLRLVCYYVRKPPTTHPPTPPNNANDI